MFIHRKIEGRLTSSSSSEITFLFLLSTFSSELAFTFPSISIIDSSFPITGTLVPVSKQSYQKHQQNKLTKQNNNKSKKKLVNRSLAPGILRPSPDSIISSRSSELPETLAFSSLSYSLSSLPSHSSKKDSKTIPKRTKFLRSTLPSCCSVAVVSEGRRSIKERTHFSCAFVRQFPAPKTWRSTLFFFLPSRGRIVLNLPPNLFI